MLTITSTAACGFPFRAGERYLVYAQRREWSGDPGALWVDLCSRTHETRAGDPDVALLNAGPLPALRLTLGPNPSSGPTRVAWTVLGGSAGPARARLDVVDAAGRSIRTLDDRVTGGGVYEIYWDGVSDDGRQVPAGLYWVRLSHGDRVTARRLVRIGTRP